MFTSELQVPVRYSETDQMGVVYHANYVIWFELGRTQLVEDLGFRYADMEAAGYVSPVLDVQATFVKPIRYGEQACVKTWVADYNGVKTTYGYEIRNQAGEVCVAGKSSHVVVKRESFRPISMRKVFPEWHEAYEQAQRQD